MTTKSINDRLGDGGFESVATFSEDGDNNVEGLIAPNGSLIRLPQLIDQYYEPVQRTADGTTDTTVVKMGEITVPGGLMNLNGKIEIEVDWFYSSSAIAKNLRIYWGGLWVAGPQATTSVRANHRFAIKNQNSLTAQTMLNGTTFTTAAINTTTSFDTSNDLLIEFKCDWTAMATGEQITLLGYCIWYYPGTT